MVNITVNYNGTDNCGTPTCSISSVTSNEHIDNTDYEIVDPHHVRLRAERDGKDDEHKGDGNDNEHKRDGKDDEHEQHGKDKDRIYTITVTCKDSNNNSSSQAVQVKVPHDQGKKSKSMRSNATTNFLRCATLVWRRKTFL